MRRHNFLALICLALFAPSLFGQGNAPAREQLQQLTAQLQNSPGDQPLREKIIALALTLNPKPATPDAAIMAEGAAEYAFKNAKVNSDYSDAAKQYEKALVLAPWVSADYFNCGVAHDKAGEYKEAIRSFSLYLLASPNADDTLAVKKRIGGLQYVAQKSEDEANRPAKEAAAKEAAEKAADRMAGWSDNRDGTVTDLNMRLMWQKTDDGHKRNWEDSVSYCQGLSLAGYSDWRLPSKEELVYSCWDKAGSKMDISRHYFPTVRGHFYLWSSVGYTGKDKDAAGRFWEDDGTVEPGLKKFLYFARCVRRQP